MLEGILIAVVAIPYLVGVRLFAGHFAWWQVENWYRKQKKPDADDWFCAILAALFWPLLLAMKLAMEIFVMWPSRQFTKALPRGRAIGAERRALERKRREEHEKRAKELKVPVE